MFDLKTVIIVLLAVLLLVAVVVILIMVMKNKKSPVTDFVHRDLLDLRREVHNLQNELGKTLNERLDKNQQSMSHQLSESSKLINDVSARLTKLDDTNARVIDVTTELKTIQNVLQNPKQRGTFGEFQLESVLANVMAPTQYQMQFAFANREVVDAVVFLDRGKILPIDSKFSLENYNRMIDAKDKTAHEHYWQLLARDLKTRIDETSKYRRPSEGTLDLVFMFIPSESLYYDLLVRDVGAGSATRSLIDYAYKDKKVIIVSPTTLIAYLQTVLQGLRSLEIEEKTKDIIAKVGQLQKHLNRYSEYHAKIGSSLQTVVNHYNKGSGQWQQIDKDVVKIAGGDLNSPPELIEGPQ